MADKKELSLLKGTERFIFRYEVGSEERILDSFVEMAQERKNNFDWFDAAVLSFQLSKHLVEQADQLLGANNLSHETDASEAQMPWTAW